ncbi:MAG: DUF4037 domain-containing protein [Clostridia bacterium]|nr:DUF4037 domain-containing protein [Clostridia bacterium]
MKGLELARKFYEEYGAPMIKEKFSDIEGVIAVGLFGEGSECFGFDDDVSQDHDFEAGFCIMLPGEDVVDRRRAFELERAYSKLPEEFMGYKRSKISPVGGNRRGVMRTADFFKAKVGKEDGLLEGDEWFAVPETFLAEATNGEVFKDDFGTFSGIRAYLSEYPKDVKLKKLAGNLLLSAQSGQYNYPRCVKRGELAAAQICAVKFTESIMNCMFLLSNKYKPYYKWAFKAFSTLEKFARLYDALEFLITTDNSDENAKVKSAVIEDICGEVIAELKSEGITKATCGDLEKHAYSVNDGISDGILRTKHILSAV